CGAPAASHSAATIAETLLAEHAGARALVTFPLPVPAGVPPTEVWAALTRRGFARVRPRAAVVDRAAPPPPTLPRPELDVGRGRDRAVDAPVRQVVPARAREGGAAGRGRSRDSVGAAGRARAPPRLRWRRQVPRHQRLLRGDRVLPLQAARARVPLALPHAVALPGVRGRAAQAGGARREGGGAHHRGVPGADHRAR